MSKRTINKMHEWRHDKWVKTRNFKTTSHKLQNNHPLFNHGKLFWRFGTVALKPRRTTAITKAIPIESHYFALLCIALLYIASHCFDLLGIALHCFTLPLLCIALLCIALHHLTLLCIALHGLACFVLHCLRFALHCWALLCLALHWSAWRCIALQNLTMHSVECSTLFSIALFRISFRCR